MYAGSTLNNTNSYVYDALGRLTSGTHGGGNFQYAYDWANNRLSKAENGTITNYGYNAANRLLTVNGVTQFAYDANGNMTQSGTQGLTWDIRGQLRNIGGSTFSYDAFGRRTVKSEPTILGGTRTKNYGWTGLSQTSGDQAPVVGSGLDSPIRLERGTDGTVRVPVQDSHGNVTKVINGGSGASLFEASYSPFGERTITNENISGGDGSGQPMGFTGAEHDSVSQLVYMRNRYYSPGLGRFISEDPIGFAGSPDGNLYAYCGNDPINFSDPLGLSRDCGIWADAGSTFTAIFDPDAWRNLGDGEVWKTGALTGVNGLASGASMGLYDGGAYRCSEGFGFGVIMGHVAREALVARFGGLLLRPLARLGLGRGMGVVARMGLESPRVARVVYPAMKFVGRFYPETNSIVVNTAHTISEGHIARVTAHEMGHFYMEHGIPWKNFLYTKFKPWRFAEEWAVEESIGTSGDLLLKHAMQYGPNGWDFARAIFGGGGVNWANEYLR